MAEARAAKTEAGATVKEQARALVEQREEAAAKTAVAKVEAGEQLVCYSCAPRTRSTRRRTRDTRRWCMQPSIQAEQATAAKQHVKRVLEAKKNARHAAKVICAREAAAAEAEERGLLLVLV